MPNYYSFKKKGDDKLAKPADMDNELCAHLGVEPDEKWFYEMWYDSLGLTIACGHQLGSEKIRDIHRDNPVMLKILDFLEERYTSDSWYSVM